MLDKDDKDGIIEFLKGRISEIRDAITRISTSNTTYVYDFEDDDYRETLHDYAAPDDGVDEAVDLCDKTLLEVEF